MSISDQEIEQEIVNKELTAPRVTLDMLEQSISSEEYHVFDSTQLTICVLTLVNGFTVTGESACVSPENFDRELGEKIAKQKAMDKMWPLLGFALAELTSSKPCVRHLTN